jgi:hypothetical protein
MLRLCDDVFIVTAMTFLNGHGHKIFEAIDFFHSPVSNIVSLSNRTTHQVLTYNVYLIFTMLLTEGDNLNLKGKKTLESSVADPGSGSDHCSIRIPDPGGKKAPDPRSDLFLYNYKGY